MSYPVVSSQTSQAPPPHTPLSDPEVRPRPGRSAPGVSVTRLGPGRWRIAARLTEAGREELDLFVAPAEGFAVRLLAQGAGAYTIGIEGTPGEAGVFNLGDCLLEALEREPTSLGIAVGVTMEEASLGVLALLESFGRLTARRGGRPGVAIAGESEVACALRRAFARGAAGADRSSARGGGRP